MGEIDELIRELLDTGDDWPAALDALDVLKLTSEQRDTMMLLNLNLVLGIRDFLNAHDDGNDVDASIRRLRELAEG